MRGKDYSVTSVDPPEGITPAHAGKRLARADVQATPKDHPRPCGEKYSSQCRTSSTLGSPPPMRGKVNPVICLFVPLRITPAHAGKSRFVCWTTSTTGDHPRPCGEKRPMLQRARRQRGSPPPMRGKDSSAGSRLIPLGITPAHAGKRADPRTNAGRHEDHPRPCGEKVPPARTLTVEPGSPPPMRGKEDKAWRRPSLPGITPAHAGKSSEQLWSLPSSKDHPRPCGEKPSRACRDRWSRGSPPPMRGKGEILVSGPGINGITPAHAGKRAKVSGFSCVYGDHPRPCGEKIRLSSSIAASAGSPPPMRGKATWLRT